MVFLLSSPLAMATYQELQISPAQTDPAIQQMTSPHLAGFEDSVQPSGYLVISIGGTNSVTSDFRHVHLIAAQLGHSVLAVDYPNAVISTTCRESADLKCFENFRREVVFGTNESSIVQVDPANSLVNRIQKLLEYMSAGNPNRFAKFRTAEGVDWSKVILIGHSQGSGHAAYLSKTVPLRRLVLFAGPQDSFTTGLAAWLSLPSQTDPARIFAFLHRDDFFKSELQIMANARLHFQKSVKVQEVDSRNTPVLSPVLLSIAQEQDGHVAVLEPQYMLIFRSLMDLQD